MTTTCFKPTSCSTCIILLPTPFTYSIDFLFTCSQLNICSQFIFLHHWISMVVVHNWVRNSSSRWTWLNVFSFNSSTEFQTLPHESLKALNILQNGHYSVEETDYVIPSPIRERNEKKRLIQVFFFQVSWIQPYQLRAYPSTCVQTVVYDNWKDEGNVKI